MTDERLFDYSGSSQGDVPRRTVSPEVRDPYQFQSGEELRSYLRDCQSVGDTDEDMFRYITDFMVERLEVSFEALGSYLVERMS